MKFLIYALFLFSCIIHAKRDKCMNGDDVKKTYIRKFLKKVRFTKGIIHDSFSIKG